MKKDALEFSKFAYIVPGKQTGNLKTNRRNAQLSNIIPDIILQIVCEQSNNVIISL